MAEGRGYNSPVTRNAEIDPEDNDPTPPPKMTQGGNDPPNPLHRLLTASLSGQRVFAFDWYSIFPADFAKHKAMSYERMKKREGELQAEADGWLKAAEAADAAEDKAFGSDKRGDEM